MTVFDVTADATTAAGLGSGFGRTLAIRTNSVVWVVGKNGVYLVQEDASATAVVDLSDSDENWEYKISCWR